MVKLTIYVTERQHDELKQLAVLTGMGFAEALRHCLEPGLTDALRYERERSSYTSISLGDTPRAREDSRRKNPSDT
jgi:hypothetical protein